MRYIEQLRTMKQPAAPVLAALYVVIYIGLDHVSSIHDLQNTEITPWSPNVAWMIAVAMYYGVRVAPLTIITPGLAEMALHGAAPFGVPALGAMLCDGCTYTIAGLLLRRLQRDSSEPTIRWFSILLLVIAASALVDALAYSAVLIWSGNLTAGSYPMAVRIGWVGDMNGIIILLPLVLILRNADPAVWREVRSNIWLLVAQMTSLALIFWFTFGDIGFADGGKQTRFYLLFLPVIWIALRWGAAVTALVLVMLQAAVVLFVASHNTPDSFLGIQVLMVLLAGTGLFMGISTAENARISSLMRAKDDQLSYLSARTAVSELNAAIGHELNNPLAALVNYLRSASLILGLPSLDRGSLQNVLDKALGEAMRSADVVRKLRAFFRFREVHRQHVDAKKLAAECLATMQTKLRNAGVGAVLDAPPDLPLVAADPLHLSMVLQNLVTNAYDALSDSAPRRRKITVELTHDAKNVQFYIEDTGPGLPGTLRDRIFHPVSSTKPAGMGLGLAICRSLVEANEGRIWLARSDSDGTRIAFSIPIGALAQNEGRA